MKVFATSIYILNGIIFLITKHIMARFNVHMSINLEGMLRNYRGKRINIFDDDNGCPIPDAEARAYIQECLNKGWKVIPMGGENICEGFDFFGKGCPKHEIAE